MRQQQNNLPQRPPLSNQYEIPKRNQYEPNSARNSQTQLPQIRNPSTNKNPFEDNYDPFSNSNRPSSASSSSSSQMNYQQFPQRTVPTRDWKQQQPQSQYINQQPSQQNYINSGSQYPNAYGQIQSVTQNARLSYENYDKVQPTAFMPQKQLQIPTQQVQPKQQQIQKSKDDKNNKETKVINKKKEEEDEDDSNRSNSESGSERNSSDRDSGSEEASNKSSSREGSQSSRERSSNSGSEKSGKKKRRRNSSSSEDENDSDKQQSSSEEDEKEKEFLGRSGIRFKSENQIMKVRKEIEEVNNEMTKFENELNEVFPYLTISDKFFKLSQSGQFGQDQNDVKNEKLQQTQDMNFAKTTAYSDKEIDKDLQHARNILIAKEIQTQKIQKANHFDQNSFIAQKNNMSNKQQRENYNFNLNEGEETKSLQTTQVNYYPFTRQSDDPSGEQAENMKLDSPNGSNLNLKNNIEQIISEHRQQMVTNIANVIDSQQSPQSEISLSNKKLPPASDKSQRKQNDQHKQENKNETSIMSKQSQKSQQTSQQLKNEALSSKNNLRNQKKPFEEEEGVDNNNEEKTKNITNNSYNFSFKTAEKRFLRPKDNSNDKQQ